MDKLTLANYAITAGKVIEAVNPLPFLAPILNIATIIIQRAETAEHNKSTCRKLAARVQIANDTLLNMPAKNLENNPALDAYVQVLEDINAFIEKASEYSKFIKWLNSNEIKGTFDGLTGRLDVCMKDLGLNTLVRTNQQIVEDKAILDNDLNQIKEFMVNVNNGLSNVDNRISELIETVKTRQVSSDVLAASKIQPGEISEPDDSDYPIQISQKIVRRVWRYQNVALKDFGVAHGPLLNELTKEVALLKQLEQCQFVIDLYGTMQLNGRLYVVMEFCAHGALNDHLKKHAVDWKSKVSIALDIVRGMCFLHEIGILHHDLRACNILLTKTMNAKITNFSTSRTEADVSRSVLDDMSKVRWTAPEKTKDPKLAFSKRCDVFSFGMTLFEIASNKAPFQELDHVQAFKRISGGEREAVPVGTPVEFKQAMTSAWNQEPRDRPTMSELFLMLKAARDNYGKTIVVQAEEDDDDLLNFTIELDDEEQEPLPPMAAGLEAHKSKDYERAWHVFKANFDANSDAQAAYWIGYYVYRGLAGQEPNKTVATTFWKDAADASNSDAQLRYGACLMQGDGVAKNILLGFTYIDKAAQQGNIGAEFNAGDLYWSGRVKGINKDETKAKLYLSSAAKKGHPQAKQVCTKWGIPY